MATKIRRSLFVGLGGTGMTTLLHTKKMFVETYGEVPPMVAFLGIDTDNGWYTRSLPSTMGEVKLIPAEQMRIVVEEDPQPIYMRNINNFSWLPSRNLSFLKSMDLGAGQVRSNGRFAFTYNERTLRVRLNNVITGILNVSNSINPNYELLDKKLEVHVVFSLGGGTGCGTFINTAYLIRELCPEAKIYGYAVLPDIFETMIQGAGTSRVKPNAYGALKDLDFLMHLDMGKTPVRIEYLQRSSEVNRPPYNVVYLIDNKNANNDIYTHVDQLTEMISLALMTSTGALSQATASVGDNVEHNIQNGSMNIEDKEAWVSGFGVCEICYRGGELKKIFTEKVVQRIVERLLNSCADTNSIANNWIDAEQIRENNQKDQVIDYICGKTANIPFNAINTPASPKGEVDAYLTNLALPRPAEVEAKLATLKERIEPSLLALVQKQLNQECGIYSILGVLTNIMQQVEICLDEMRSELEDFQNKEPGLISAKDSAIQELINCMDTWMKRHKDEYMENVINAVNQLTICKREIVRRQAAITFYTWLTTILTDHQQEVLTIKSMLKGIYEDSRKRINDLQYGIGNLGSTFVIDLAEREANNISYDDEEIVMSDFLKSVILPNKVYDFKNCESKDVKKMIADYADTLPGSKRYAERSVDEVLRSLNENELKQVLHESIVKSQPLIKYNPQGYVPMESPEDYYYIGVSDEKSSTLKQNDLFKNMINANVQIQFSSIGVKDRIVIYRQFGNMPVFTVESIAGYKLKYDKTVQFCNCSWDATMEKRMINDGYSIMPSDSAISAVELWVKGLIFGLVKHEDDKYYFRCEEKGDILYDYWMQLPSDRDDAFAEFKSYAPSLVKEYEKYYKDMLTKEGKDTMDKKIADAKVNYRTKYAQLGFNESLLQTKGYERVQALFRDELLYVKNHLE